MVPSLWLWLLSAPSWAATTDVQLPAGQRAEDWQQVLQLVEMELAEPGEEPEVLFVAAGAQWKVRVVGRDGSWREATIELPLTADARERAARLAYSLRQSATDAGFRWDGPRQAAPTAPPAAPPRPPPLPRFATPAPPLEIDAAPPPPAPAEPPAEQVALLPSVRPVPSEEALAALPERGGWGMVGGAIVSRLGSYDTPSLHVGGGWLWGKQRRIGADVTWQLPTQLDTLSGDRSYQSLTFSAGLWRLNQSNFSGLLLGASHQYFAQDGEPVDDLWRPTAALEFGWLYSWRLEVQPYARVSVDPYPTYLREGPPVRTVDTLSPFTLQIGLRGGVFRKIDPAAPVRK